MIDTEPRNVSAAVLRVVSTSLTLHFASRQELVTLRHLPLLILSGAVIAHVPHTIWSLRSHPSDGPVTQFPKRIALLLGFIKGIQMTLFVWSLVKIPPGPALALYAISEPLSQIIISSRKTSLAAPPRTWITAAFLVAVISRTVPMNPHSLFFALFALVLSITLKLANTQYLEPSTLRNPLYNLIKSICALGPAVILTGMMSGKVFGENLNHPYYLKTIKLPAIVAYALTAFASHYVVKAAGRTASVVGSIKTLGVATSVVNSFFVPVMGARVTLWDLALLGAVAGLAFREALSKGTQELSGSYSVIPV